MRQTLPTREGVNEASKAWANEYDRLSARYDALDRTNDDINELLTARTLTIADREDELLRERRKNVIADCQRFGYVRAIGLLKGIIANSRIEKDWRDIYVSTAFTNKADGTSIPIYESLALTRVRRDQFEAINDVSHTEAWNVEVPEEKCVLSIYEEQYLRGFIERAEVIWKRAEEEDDKLTLDAMVTVGSIQRAAFDQTFEDAADLDRARVEGEVMGIKYVGRWQDEIQDINKKIASGELTVEEMEKRESKYDVFLMTMRDKIKKEADEAIKKGKSKYQFI
ncbi:hypothetical protein [Bombella apis]|uniref:Uncharacterized protein n=1 Tax=Bombella apis TaxID=1785988 RepID=A0ABR9MR39_9PROT|nr:hypothetical protein [Bombella apis]MBE1723974.1 hypothetical protein [Bombella apis]MBR9730313.1 hypothetical protein [Bombella apis]